MGNTEGPVCQFFKEHCEEYGFSRLVGPLHPGPDFVGFYGGEPAVVEVEMSWKGYVNHRHHLSSRFEHVNVLVVLSSQQPESKFRNMLPKTIVHLNADDYNRWRKVEGLGSAPVLPQILSSRMSLLRAPSDETRTCDYCDRRNGKVLHCIRRGTTGFRIFRGSMAYYCHLHAPIMMGLQLKESEYHDQEELYQEMIRTDDYRREREARIQQKRKSWTNRGRPKKETGEVGTMQETIDNIRTKVGRY